MVGFLGGRTRYARSSTTRTDYLRWVLARQACVHQEGARLEVEDRGCQPVRAKARSPWRKPWEESETSQPRNGAKEPFCWRVWFWGILLRPVPGLGNSGHVPTAGALGYYLAPLPGLSAHQFARPTKVRMEYCVRFA